MFFKQQAMAGVKIETEDGVLGWVSLAYLTDSAPDSAPTGGLAGKVTLYLILVMAEKTQVPLAKILMEKDLTLSTAKKLQTKLEAAGATVYMTRTGDTYPTLDERVQYQ